MALDSTSTYAQALAQYNDNLSYEGSSSKVALFIEACRWMRVNRAQVSTDSATSMSFESISEDLAKAEKHRDALVRTYRSPFVRARPL